MANDKTCLAILGPTCCWKSGLGIRLAKALEGEVISCDSMQIYRGLDIGTAKATAAERRGIPHHLIDALDITEPYDANQFVAMARTALAEIRDRGHRPILVGGTGLYARALIYGFSMLPADPQVFKKYDAICQQPDGQAQMLCMLSDAARQCNTPVPDEYRLNPRRLIRACEVLELTGKPPWVIATKNDVPDPTFMQFCIVPPLDMARERIRIRTAQMLKHGWLEEAEKADKNGLMQTPTARQALGYSEIIDYIHNGKTMPLDKLAELLANRTIQYARRQLTWFKHQHPGAVMLVPPAAENAETWLFEEILRRV